MRWREFLQFCCVSERGASAKTFLAVAAAATVLQSPGSFGFSVFLPPPSAPEIVSSPRC